MSRYGLLPTVATVLDPWVTSRPDLIALTDPDNRMTYRELDQRVEAVAAGLAGRGIVTGDRVGVSLPNGAATVILFLAIARLGAVFVGIGPSLLSDERRWIEEDAQLSLSISAPGSATGATASLEADPSAAGADVAGGDRGRVGREVTGADILAIAYTSGTTGRPKGAVHDHQNVLLPAEVILRDRMGGRAERIGVQLPLTTLNVMIVGPLLGFLGGGSVACSTARDPGRLGEWLQAERIEHLACSPATAHDFVHDPTVRPEDLKHLRLGVGGAACPEALRVSYRAKFGTDFTTGYGLTEAPAAIVQETETVGHRSGGSGRAMAHVDVVILGDNLEPVGPGVTGQIAVAAAGRGPWSGRWTGLREYWRRPEMTATARSGRYLLTGDDGWLDDEGYLYVTGRRSEMINRGGSKVSPAEVEEVLRAHPAVDDCLVFGLPDERLGEVVAAVAESGEPDATTESELRSHCRDRLAGYKVPSVIVVAPKLERNPMGKIDRDAATRLLDTQPPR